MEKSPRDASVVVQKVTGHLYCSGAHFASSFPTSIVLSLEQPISFGSVISECQLRYRHFDEEDNWETKLLFDLNSKEAEVIVEQLTSSSIYVFQAKCVNNLVTISSLCA